MTSRRAARRRFGADRSIAAQVEGDSAIPLDRGRHQIMSAVLGLLRAAGGPWIMVLKDLQWADEATFELLKVVGRRIAQLPALVSVQPRPRHDRRGRPRCPSSRIHSVASTVSGDAAAVRRGRCRTDPRHMASILFLALHRAAAGTLSS